MDKAIINVSLANKKRYLSAMAKNGISLTRQDAPDHRMDGYAHRGLYGSIWRNDKTPNDISAFWRAVEESPAE